MVTKLELYILTHTHIHTLLWSIVESQRKSIWNDLFDNLHSLLTFLFAHIHIDFFASQTDHKK